MISPLRIPLRSLALAAAAVALTGCISLFPKSEPAGLYRFGHAAAESSRPASDKSFGVYKTPTVFTRAAMSDRLLSVTNGEAAYIADARWVSPAIVLFDEAVARAFESDASPARLVTRGEALKASMALRLEVRSFETDYVDGPKAAPEVLVEIRAVTTRSNDRALLGDKVFVARVKAADNRLSAIIPAYDQAVGQALSEIVDWVGETGAKLPAS
ncbi:MULTISPECIES: ABC-type transport auxiliary lipoprotein family protein [Caulobacter]|uniref:Cholesterol transport system auxiliary component n=1 Tax=Caulobacter rhizosphaerae TaxID=2010972 RepID=A0ABU1N217_9CAUL|nr:MULTISPECIES: ABC-type transport auxiliary lipoprotein family protein [Caulobacter]KQZ27933.1 ABC transporter [Caulobacter sp. Root1472]MDR6532457.1 cholesterol transport system auxiliary component [Caulobacter rhizosphaerae]